MKVSFYKNHSNTIETGRSKDVGYYLDRIRNGASKKIIDQVRASLTKQDANVHKSQLPAVTFAGTFKTRDKKGLKEASGLCILDFDNIKTEEAIQLKEELKSDAFIYASWISPSANGLKALVKIPTVQSDAEYLLYYKSIVEYFSWVNDAYGEKTIDMSGKDISRLCYESHDPEIYVNPDSMLYTDSYEAPVIEIGINTDVPIIDKDVIANRLMIWFKRNYDGTNRNNSLHKLALAMNDFGVPEMVCKDYLLPFEQADFKADEIERLIKSAYKHTANHGTKFFEDHEKKKKIENMTVIGKSFDEIKAAVPDLSEDQIKSAVERVKNTVNLDVFWYFDEKGRIKMSPHRFKFYLENKGYFKHYPVEKTKTFTFITKDGNFIDEVSEFQIKDSVLTSLIETDELKAFDLMSSSSKAFTPPFLSMIDTAKISIERDTKEYGTIYYRNTALRVWADKREEIPYDNLDGFVWKKQIIDREWSGSDHHDSVYRSFIWFAAGQNVQKYNSLKSVIGYLMHSFKTSSNNKAIIFNDEMISDSPNGRSGKGLFWNGLSQLKKVSSIDGKSFDFNNTFPYQTVSADSQILVFDDVKKNFNFESLFSLITEGITLEYKGQDAIKLPVSESPKIIITTNYTIKGEGGSHEARKFEVEMSSYFNANRTPLQVFGHMFFEDWDDAEWSRFDAFMINCLQYYLQNGLIPFPFTNLDQRKLINETSIEFIEYMESFKYNERVGKNEMFEEFKKEYTDFQKWLSQNVFSRWVKKYAEHHGYRFETSSSNGWKWYMIDKNKEQSFDECPF